VAGSKSENRARGCMRCLKRKLELTLLWDSSIQSVLRTTCSQVCLNLRFSGTCPSNQSCELLSESGTRPSNQSCEPPAASLFLKRPNPAALSPCVACSCAGTAAGGWARTGGRGCACGVTEAEGLLQVRVCVCVCVRARVFACVCVCVNLCMCMCV